MSRTRLIISITGLTVLASLLAVWAGMESRRQRIRTEASLRSQAAVLAGVLAPALSAAAASVRELEEIVAWKLLDNARLIGWLDAERSLGDRDLELLLESNDLDSVVILDRKGMMRARVGSTEICDQVASGFPGVVTGDAGEAILGSSPEEAGGHVAVAVAHPSGGAVVVTAHESTMFAYAGRLGVDNLLESTIGTGGVLYLVYSEEPAAYHAEATWDGEPAPPPGDGSEPLRTVRDRTTFEVEMPVQAVAGRSASLRVGLEATPLLAVSVSAARRTALIGIVLVAFGLVGTAFALVSRARTLERAENMRKLSEVEEKKRRSERLAAAGTLAAGIAHEIRNPLNAISLAAQRLERDEREDSGQRRFAAGIRQEVHRLEEILKGFLDLARPASRQRTSTDLYGLSLQVVSLLEPEASERSVIVHVEETENPVAAVVDGEAVRRAILNLVRNAILASPPGGTVIVQLGRKGSLVRITVLDEGRTPEPEMIESVFDPFVTTRADGVGLGLPLVRRVAEEHGGWARLEKRSSTGTRAVMELSVGEGVP
jgi:signal transduction histidine kinase